MTYVKHQTYFKEQIYRIIPLYSLRLISGWACLYACIIAISALCQFNPALMALMSQGGGAGGPLGGMAGLAGLAGMGGAEMNDILMMQVHITFILHYNKAVSNGKVLPLLQIKDNPVKIYNFDCSTV